MLDFMKLQHGNAILGIAGDGKPFGMRDGELRETKNEDSDETALRDEITLSEEAAGAIAGAFAYWLGFKVGKNPYDLRICVGQDPRISGDTLKTGLLKGITMFGAEPYDTGLAVSSAMYMSTVLPQLDFDGAIMITAGGRLREWNGFRLFTKEGELDADEVAKILKTASRYNFVGEYFEERRTNALQMYAAYLRQMISLGLKDVPGCLSGMHIVVNAGNGAGGFFAKDVLEPMGADISGSRYLEPDGLFPNHAPDTSNKEALDVTCISVLQNEADLGIVFSADGGRVAVIGPDGRPVSPDAFIALAAALAAEDYQGSTVVTDSATSDKLHEFLENDLGLKHLRYKSGFSNIIRKAKELNAELGDQGDAAGAVFLAADTSGNIAYSDNSFFNDGVFLATQIVINAAQLKSKGKTILDQIEGLGAPAESCEILFRLAADNADDAGGCPRQ